MNDNWPDYQEESLISCALNPRKPSTQYQMALERLENNIYKRLAPKLFLPKLKKDRLIIFKQGKVANSLSMDRLKAMYMKERLCF